MKPESVEQTDEIGRRLPSKLGDVTTTIDVKHTLPPVKGGEFRLIPDEDGGLVYNDGAGPNPRQGTLDSIPAATTPKQDNPS